MLTEKCNNVWSYGPNIYSPRAQKVPQGQAPGIADPPPGQSGIGAESLDMRPVGVVLTRARAILRRDRYAVPLVWVIGV